MKLQVNNKFQQVKIQNLNDQNDVKIFTTSVRGGKAFVAEQKVGKFKTAIAKLSIQKLNVLPTKIILKFAENVNNVDSEKYGMSPEEIEKRASSDKNLRRFFIFTGQKKLDKCMKD